MENTPSAVATRHCLISVLVAMASFSACSVDSKGFGNDDGGSGTGGATSSGGATGVGSGGAAGYMGGEGGKGGAPGTGGVIGTGGTKGGGGGGVPGTGGIKGGGGGVPGTAGTKGSGGGGAPGTGGTKGSGGATSTGGSGGGGSGAGGQGGRPMDVPTCDELVTAYSKAFAEARTCTPGAVAQCQALATSTLTSCVGCQMYVNDATTLTAIRAQWTSQNCSKPVLCPAIACVLPKQATCIATDAAAPGGDCSATGIAQ